KSVSLDQSLDALGRAVEAFGQCGDLVAAFDLHARAKIAGSQLLDAGLQPLDAPAEAADNGIGADRDNDVDQRQEGRNPEGGIGPFAYLARDQPSSVGKL